MLTPQAGGINGRMTLTLAQTGAIQPWKERIYHTSKMYRRVNDSFTKVADLVRMTCEFRPHFMRNLSVFDANLVRFKIEFCPLLMRLFATFR